MAVARREERLKELAEECKDAPGEMTWYAGDVGDPETAVGMVKKAVETFGRLDVAVNCAGVMDDNTAIADMSDEMLEKTFRINTFGLMYGLREECKQYLAQGDGGVIVNQWCTTSMKSGEFIAGGDYPNDAYSPTIHKAVEIDGIAYDEYVFVRNKALEAGAMTEWNVWNFIGISKDADWDDIQKAIDAGALTKAEDGTISFNVLVQADAIQAEGFRRFRQSSIRRLP